MGKIAAIALITVKEESRNKVIYILLAVALLLLFWARGCTPGKLNLEKSILTSEQIVTAGTVITFNGILWWVLSMCGLLAMNTLPRELVEGTAVLTITKPIKRSWFLMGKFLGVFFIIFVNQMLLCVGFFLLLYFRTGKVTLKIFTALGVTLFNLVLTISLIFLFTLFLPRVVSALLTLTLYTTSLVLSILFSFEKVRSYWKPSFSAQVLHWLLPRFGEIHLYASSFLSSYFPSAIGFWSMINVVGYTVAVWVLMVLVFERKSL